MSDNVVHTLGHQCAADDLAQDGDTWFCRACGQPWVEVRVMFRADWDEATATFRPSDDTAWGAGGLRPRS